MTPPLFATPRRERPGSHRGHLGKSPALKAGATRGGLAHKRGHALVPLYLPGIAPEARAQEGQKSLAKLLSGKNTRVTSSSISLVSMAEAGSFKLQSVKGLGTTGGPGFSEGGNPGGRQLSVGIEAKLRLSLGVHTSVSPFVTWEGN